jgi:hypothetical protein
VVALTSACEVNSPNPASIGRSAKGEFMAGRVGGGEA